MIEVHYLWRNWGCHRRLIVSNESMRSQIPLYLKGISSLSLREPGEMTREEGILQSYENGGN